MKQTEQDQLRLREVAAQESQAIALAWLVQIALKGSELSPDEVADIESNVNDVLI